MLRLMKVVPEAEPNAEGAWVRLPDRLDLYAGTRRWTDLERRVEPWVPEGHFACGVDVVGKERDHAFQTSWLHDLLLEWAWPGVYDLTGSGRYPYGQRAEVPAHRRLARRLWAVVARRCGVHDPGRY